MNNNKFNSPIDQNEEEEILTLIDAHEQDEASSPYTDVLSLFADARNNITPEASLLRQTLHKLPSSTQLTSGAPSPYVSFFTQFSSWRFATPALVLFLAVATIIGVNQKKTQAPELSLATNEVISPMSADLTGGNAEVTSFAMTETALPEGAPEPMMMAKMSMTTLPSSTPQNIGELIALLSNEADMDVNLGATDVNDPLYSVDSASVDAIQQSYDVQTI